MLLNNFIYANPKTMKEFEKYHRNIDFILNISFSINNKKNDFFYATANNLFENKIKSGLTSEEILKIIGESEIKKYMHKTPIDKTLQFASINHEIREREIIFSEFSILDF